MAILLLQFLSEKNIIRTIGRDSFGYPKSITYEEMLSFQYIKDYLLLVAYWAIWYFGIVFVLKGPIAMLAEWEESAFRRRKVKKRKFEEYHNYKFNSDD